MPRKKNLASVPLKSKVPFTLYVQRGLIEWVQTVAPPHGASDFIDRLIFNAKEQYEQRLLKRRYRRALMRISELERFLVQFGVDLPEQATTVEAINEELQ